MTSSQELISYEIWKFWILMGGNILLTFINTDCISKSVLHIDRQGYYHLYYWSKHNSLLSQESLSPTFKLLAFRGVEKLKLVVNLEMSPKKLQSNNVKEC